MGKTFKFEKIKHWKKSFHNDNIQILSHIFFYLPENE